MAESTENTWLVIVCLNCEAKFWVSTYRPYCTTCSARPALTRDDVLDATEALSHMNTLEG